MIGDRTAPIWREVRPWPQNAGIEQPSLSASSDAVERRPGTGPLQRPSCGSGAVRGPVNHGRGNAGPCPGSPDRPAAHLKDIRLDLDDDGASNQSLTEFRFHIITRPISDFLIGFVQSNVPWPRDYRHFLIAMTDLPLAHYWLLTFDQTFQNLFPRSAPRSCKIVTETAITRNLVRVEPECLHRPDYPDHSFRPGEDYQARK